MDRLEIKVKNTIEEYHMLEPDGRVLAALSGGADSVCLLRLLVGLSGPLGLRLRAVHVHHGLRGREADRDAQFAQQLCDALAVPFHMIKVDVRGYAKQRGLSEEEAGRILRYEALEREACRWEEEEGQGTAPAVRIAVAHHSGDQAETILHNLFRGSGLGGLKGIPYVRGRIIRPLLEADKEEIVAYLKERDIGWVQDSTNTSGHYTRNRIRSQVLPLIEEEVNPAAASNLVRMGKLAAMADSYLEERAADWVSHHGIMNLGENGNPCTCHLPIKELANQAPIIQNYIIMYVLKALAGASKDLSWVHVASVLALLTRQVGRQADLPYGLLARREYQALFLGSKEQEHKEQAENKPHTQVQFAVFPYKKGEIFPQNIYTKWFDCDKIKGMPVIRTRQTGDYILLADGSRKTINRFMIDEKVPRQQRDTIGLLADGSHVMWIIGYRISEYYKIGPDTKRVLEARASV